MKMHELAIARPLPDYVAQRLPTALEERPDLGDPLGVELLLKREDRLDDLGGGHKVRKLAHVVQDALARDADVLVTPGSVPSSQCVAVAAAARRHGLRAHLIYCGDHQKPPSTPSGSYLLAQLLEPSITWMEYVPWSRWQACVEAVVAREREGGARPYVVEPGISAWPGVLGSVELGLELDAQLHHDAVPTWIVAPAGSGGTCVGIALAGRLRGRDWRVVGVCIGESQASVERQALQLRREAARSLGEPELEQTKVTFFDGALGAGYDMPTAQEQEATRDALQRHGLVLDPTYMVKAWRGLHALAAAAAIPRGARVVLVHTGGHHGIFDMRTGD
jgi:1-aminocyclopropane-1-carboxylate deaminase/D-cysteine desulfhydrase-like pyridoxal-dependent ACC family enzyme